LSSPSHRAARGAAADRTAGPPNILVLIADDLGDCDVGCYGHPTIRTPALDSLAAGGVRFSAAFVTTSSCSPSRASFFTGRYPHATGAEDLHVPLPASQRILPAYLKDLGYHTANVGKLHLGTDGAAQFERVEEEVEAWRDVLTESPAGKPFFLAVGFHEPHRPYESGWSTAPATGGEVLVPPFLADTAATRADLALYYDYTRRMDSRIAEILAFLREQGLERNTLVMFFSDNGMPFPRAKTTMYDSGIRTPLILRWPGHFPPGAVSNGLISTVDLAPTLLALAGGRPAPEMQGSDLSCLLREPCSDGKEYIHAEANWHDMDDHVRAVRDSRYKYIRNYYPREAAPISLDLLQSPSYVELLRLRDMGELDEPQMRRFMIPRPAEELYDTCQDPYEFRNLAGVSQMGPVLARLRAECDRWLQASGGDVSPRKRRVDLMDPVSGKITGQFGQAPLRPDNSGEYPDRER